MKFLIVDVKDSRRFLSPHGWTANKGKAEWGHLSSALLEIRGCSYKFLRLIEVCN